VGASVTVAVGLGLEVDVEVGNSVGMLVGIGADADVGTICFAGAQALKSIIVKMKIKDRLIHMLFSRIAQITFVSINYFNPITS